MLIFLAYFINKLTNKANDTFHIDHEKLFKVKETMCHFNCLNYVEIYSADLLNHFRLPNNYANATAVNFRCFANL